MDKFGNKNVEIVSKTVRAFYPDLWRLNVRIYTQVEKFFYAVLKIWIKFFILIFQIVKLYIYNKLI